MQVFLPLPHYRASLKTLDTKRLGKQRVEALQLIQGSWPNHPASVMFRNYHNSLCEYGIECCLIWRSKGFADTCLEQIIALIRPNEGWSKPWWFGRPSFHSSHRSNLLRKNRGHYGNFLWQEPDDLEYEWPGSNPD